MTLKYKNISDYVFVKNMVPSDICDEAVKILEDPNQLWKQHTWYTTDSKPGTNKNDFLSVHDKEFDITYSLSIQSSLNQYIKEFGKLYTTKYQFEYLGDDAAGFFSKSSPIKINRYKEGQCILPHHDHIHSLFDGGRKGIPILSIIGLLNDDYEGGEFFMWGETKYDLKKGDMIAFPSVFMYPHHVTEVTRGTRYSWVTWCY